VNRAERAILIALSLAGIILPVLGWPVFASDRLTAGVLSGFPTIASNFSLVDFHVARGGESHGNSRSL
jgi:hypothetical protein